MKEIFCLGSKHQGRASRFAWQRKSGHLLAVVGADNSLHVYDKQGDVVDTINLPGSCLAMEWDSEGTFIAFITEFSSTVVVWNSADKKTTRVDTGQREGLSTLIWSPTATLLAIGSSKGNLVLYDHENRSKVPVIGKHVKRISCGCWNKSNTILALSGADNVVSMSNRDGDTVLEVPMKGDASKLKFVHFAGDGTANGRRTSITPNLIGSSSENSLCVLVSCKSFMFIPVSGDEVTQLSVTDDKNNLVIDYHVFTGKSALLVGFTGGSFLVFSISPTTFGQELLSFNGGSRGTVSSFSVCQTLGKIAVCSSNAIKIFALGTDLCGQEIEDVVKIDDEKSLAKVEYSEDGKMMAVSSSTSGSLHVFLAQMSVIGATFDSKIAYTTSLTEVTVSDIYSGSEDVTNVIQVETEPSVLCVGPYHVAAVMNNKAWFYSLNDGHFVRSYEYVAIVTDLMMNGDFAAALFTDGKVNLHEIELTDPYEKDKLKSDHQESKMIEEKGKKGTKITKVLMTNDFLIHSSSVGTIEHFFLEDWSTVNVFRHSYGIKVLSSDLTGIHVAFIDDQESLFLYDSITDQLTDVQTDSYIPRTIFWDKVADVDGTPSGVFAIIDESNQIHTHNFVEETIEGSKVNYVSSMALPKDYHPLVIFNGNFTCQTPSGKVTSFTLSSHDYLSSYNQEEDLKKISLPNSLKLTRYMDSIEIVERMETKGVNEAELFKCYNLIAKCAMYNFRLDIAVQMYKKCGDIGMIYSINNIINIEEKNLLAGNIALLLEIDVRSIRKREQGKRLGPQINGLDSSED